MNRLYIIIGMSCFLTTLGVAVPAGEKQAPFKQTPDEAKVFELTNAERKKKDLPPLALNALLGKLARAHSENMARQGKLEHTLDDKSPFDRLRDAKYLFARAGENVGHGEDGSTHVMIMEAWMNSEGHRKNILEPDYTEIGVGVAKDKKGDTYYTQVFARPRKS